MVADAATPLSAAVSVWSVRRAAVRVVPVLDVAHREPGGEHGEKAVGRERQREAVGQRDQPERQEAFHAEGLLAFAAQVDDGAAERRAEQPSRAPGRRRVAHSTSTPTSATP